ncbi:MAG: hypothetical protein RJS97_23470 [Parvibaculaceae bacterium]
MARIRLMVILCLCLTTRMVSADSVSVLIGQISDYCRVPAGLLYAVARVESGRWVAGEVEPWPWTLNVAGEAKYFESREAQFNALMQALQAGQGVDIGPLQLNWWWQFDRLNSPWLATDPVFNLVTGCNILRELYDHPDSHGSWHWAIGKYHRRSEAPQHVAAANLYADLVVTFWDGGRP